MLLCKQPGDTGIYATATSSQVRLYYVLDRVFPLVSDGAAAAEAAGVLGNGSCGSVGGIDTSTTPEPLADTSPELLPYVTGAPACVPREYLRTLCRLSPFCGGGGGGGSSSVTAATVCGTGGRTARYSGGEPPASLATSASQGCFSPLLRTGARYAASASDDGPPPQRPSRDADPTYRWGTSLTPFHTVPCGANAGNGTGEVRLFSSRGGTNTPPHEWATPLLPTARSTPIFAEENGLGQSSVHTAGDLAVGYGGGYYAADPLSPARRAGGGAAHASSTTSAAAFSTVPTALSLSCATDRLLFFVANAEGLSWVGRSDATTLSPLRVSTSLQMRRHSAGRYGRPVSGGDCTVASSTPRLPRPFSAIFSAPMNTSLPTQHYASSARAATPPNMVREDDSRQNAALVSDEDGADDDGGAGGGGKKSSRHRDSSAGVAGPSFLGGLHVDSGGTLSAMAGSPIRKAAFRHDCIVTASGWDPRNSAILALGRQSGAVQLLDVEYMVGSVDRECCSSTTTSRGTSDYRTAELFSARAAGGTSAGPSTLGANRVVGGPHLVSYAGADHLSYSVVQQRQMLGPVTALDWMPQSHLTVVAARRHDGLGFYAQLLDLRASHDGVTYLGAPPEVFGVLVHTRTTDGNAPRVLCSAEQVACHPSQRYVATAGASRMRDIVQLWDVRMATRPVACQVYMRKGYTSLCWNAKEAGVVLATTRDGGLRAHTFEELTTARTSSGLPVVVTSQHLGGTASLHQSPRGFGSGGTGGGRGTGRGHRRRAPSGGPLLHHQPTSGGEQEGDRWGVNNGNLVHSGCSGTEDDFFDDSCSFRSGFSGDGAGGAMLLTDGGNAVGHGNVKAQSALKCQLPSRVPAAAVGWVCHPLSEPAKVSAAGGIPGRGPGRSRTGGVMTASGPHHPEYLNITQSATTGPLPRDDHGGDWDGDDVMARGCRTDLPQLLLLNAENGELYTQVYNPGGSTVTSLSSGTALVAAGPNAFLTQASTAYKTASYVHEEAVLDRLERQAAAAVVVAPVIAAVDAASGMTASCVFTPVASMPESNGGKGLIGGRRSPSGMTTVVSSAKRPTVSTAGVADGAQSSHTGRSSTGGGGVGAVAAAAGGGAAPLARLKGCPVDFIGLGFLDEVEEEEEEERDTLPANAAAAASSDYEHLIGTDPNANGQQSRFGVTSSLNHRLQGIAAQGTAAAGVSDDAASAGSLCAGISLGAEAALLGTRGAAAPKGVRRSGTFRRQEESLDTLAPLRTPFGASPHGPCASAASMKQQHTVAASAAGRGTPKSTAAAVPVPQELSFCEFHRIDRTQHLWWRLRSGFACDPLHNLVVLLREGVDREAYATFLYGCCAAQLLFPNSVVVSPESRTTGSAARPAAASPSLVLGLKQAVPGLLELLVSERDLRQQLGLSDTRLSSDFQLGEHHQHLAAASETAVAPLSASPSGHGIVGPVGALGLRSPLLASLSSSVEMHGRPPGFPLDPFSAAAAGIRGSLSQRAVHLAGPAINVGVNRAAPSSVAGDAARPGTAGGSAGYGVAHRPAYPIAIGMLRELVLQSMGWIAPPAAFLVDQLAGQAVEAGGARVTAAPEAAGVAEATKSSPVLRPGHPSHPAERFFVQGDGIGQHSLQEALERRVAVLVLLDRLDEAAELLALYGTHNPQYPSIALTLSAGRACQTTLMNLAGADSSGVTFWIHLMLTYGELLMCQQPSRTTAAWTRSSPGDAAGLERPPDGAASNVTRRSGAAREPVSRFDDHFTLPQQKDVVLRLLGRYPRLVLSDKVALATALLLPSHYHSGHLTNLTEVLQILVDQQYSGYSAVATASRGGQEAVVDRTHGAALSLPSLPRVGAPQERRVDAKRTLPASMLSPSVQSSSVSAVASPGSFGNRFPSPPSGPAAFGSVDSHDSNPSEIFVLSAAASTASAGTFAPIWGCSLLLVTVVGGASTDSGALQRYVDETGDLQTSLSYAVVFGNILSSSVCTWRDAYRRLLNDQGLSMWRSHHDLQIVKLLHAREEAGNRGGGGTASGGSAMHSGGIMIVPGGAVPGGGGAREAAAGTPAGGHGAALPGTGAPLTKGFPGALGSLGGELGAAPGSSSAAAMMSTQTAMMMERTLSRFAQTTATTATDRERSLREVATTAGGASIGVHETHHRAVELRCNCGQAMHATARSKSSISSMTSTNMIRKQLIPCGNPECRQWQTPMCTVCGERMEHRATELPPGRFFGWCSVCLHGGHWCHLREWFSKHTKCPVENCPCHCCDSAHLS
ncbi:hypothetical protein JKF63_04626 [Porcisia hertigi]|uniref:Uncharacterized protein n=1 Tax=Porcisia hertigi TaxID=2761500 RepID=A0A836IPV5_9TRYP|nr:hypothetical protein JKF63_04626 [Porcisia hertigi]